MTQRGFWISSAITSPATQSGLAVQDRPAFSWHGFTGFTSKKERTAPRAPLLWRKVGGPAGYDGNAAGPVGVRPGRVWPFPPTRPARLQLGRGRAARACPSSGDQRQRLGRAAISSSVSSFIGTPSTFRATQLILIVDPRTPRGFRWTSSTAPHPAPHSHPHVHRLGHRRHRQYHLVGSAGRNRSLKLAQGCGVLGVLWSCKDPHKT